MDLQKQEQLHQINRKTKGKKMIKKQYFLFLLFLFFPFSTKSIFIQKKMNEYKGILKKQAHKYPTQARSGDGEDPTEVRNFDCSKNQIGSIEDRSDR